MVKHTVLVALTRANDYILGKDLLAVQDLVLAIILAYVGDNCRRTIKFYKSLFTA